MSDDGKELRQATAAGPLPGDEGWLALPDDELVFRVESLPPDHDHDDDLLAVVRSSRHFFVRQEAAKRVRDRRRLYAFEDDRHVGQILVRHLSRREDIAYLERISMLSRHVEIRQAAQVQLARVWRRLEQPPPRDKRPTPPPPSLARDDAQARVPAAGGRPPVPVAAAVAASPSSAPVDGDEVDGSLLGWAAHFIVERAWRHLGTRATQELLRQCRDELAPDHPALGLFGVTEDARVTLDLESGPRLTRAAVRDVATWMAAFRKAADRAVPGASADSVRASTALMADALRAAGFYRAFEDAEAALAL
jgi:hypothetical protein